MALFVQITAEISPNNGKTLAAMVYISTKCLTIMGKLLYHYFGGISAATCIKAGVRTGQVLLQSTMETILLTIAEGR